METITSILDIITHFIFNWTTYFLSIPLWFVLWILFIRYVAEEEIRVWKLPLFFIISLMNPIWYLMCGMIILMIPFIYLVLWFDDKYWSKIKDKKIL